MTSKKPKQRKSGEPASTHDYTCDVCRSVFLVRSFPAECPVCGKEFTGQ